MDNSKTKRKHILHFTHIDSDALGCDVILKYMYRNDEVKTYYLQNKDVDRVITDVMNNYIMAEKIECHSDDPIFDMIFITDIGPSEETIKYIETYCAMTGCLFYGFDHHITNNLWKNHHNFVVAHNLLTLKERYGKEFVHGLNYYQFMWSHDNCDDTSLHTEETSMKISATYVLFIFMIYHNMIIDIQSSDIIQERSASYLSLIMMVRDISCYDTWEWKTNSHIACTGREDRAQALIKIIGINNAVIEVCNAIFRTKPVSDYFPSDYLAVYDYRKHASFEYVKRSNLNVRMLTKKNMSTLSVILGVPSKMFENVNVVYFSISDNTTDINEQATFINDYLDKSEKSFFMHLFMQTSTISFRSSNGKYDVSTLAQALGGGGHKSAAGVVIPYAVSSLLYNLYQGNSSNMVTQISNADYEEALNKYMMTLPRLHYFEYT